MELYNFFNSSTSYRTRIALNLKKARYDYRPVNIRGNEHNQPDYIARNPSASVPMLVDEGVELGQSLAIIDYLDARYPEPRLIPKDVEVRARVLEVAYAISCDIHPINNLRVLGYLRDVLGVSDAQRQQWYRHWVQEGLSMVERMLQRHGSGPYCFGQAPTLADCCLVPQIANARRMGCELDDFGRIMTVHQHCMEQAEFQMAAPERQPDYAI